MLDLIRIKRYGISSSTWLYRAQEGFVNLESAWHCKIDLNEGDHCTPCKATEEDRFCNAAASPNSQNLTERGIALRGVAKANCAVGSR